MGVVYVNVHVSMHLKEELAWAIDKWFQLYNGIYTTKKIKNKDVLNLKTILYALLSGL